jgi:CubicO group peptidase (beta-lactamase class C family)
MRSLVPLWFFLLGAIGVVAPVAAAPPPAGAAAELAGLWKAKRWFGPDARGALAIRKTGATYTASMVGQELPVRVTGEELSFELPRGQGRFRGSVTKGGDLIGHWYPPRPIASGGLVTPVRLTPRGANQWSGEVVPSDDVFTFYLLVQPRADGTMGVILRNQERDWASLLGPKQLVRDGNAVKLIGRPRWEKEDGPISTGSYDPESQILTLSFPGRGGSYDFRREDDASDYYPRGRQPAQYAYRPPPARDDGWPTGTLEEVGIDRAGIERLVQGLLEAPMDSATTPKVHALLIARHGKLVLEEYFHGEHRDKLHDTRSAAKSVTAVVVGAAMHAGAPLTLSTPVYALMHDGAFPADLDPQKRSMTLEHLLTMSAGYFCDDTNDEAPGNEDRMQSQTHEPDWLRYTLAVPMATPPGEKSVYCSASPNLALGMVARATGASSLDLFDRLVGGPMGIRQYGWPIDPAGNPYGGGSLHLLSRDFMKFGQLMLDGGTWHGRRVLSREYAERATTPLYHLRGREYGYLWWSLEYPYKDHTVRAYYAGGNGGQAVIVIPALDLVIATQGGNYASPGTFFVQMTVVPRDLLPAVREPGDDPHRPVTARTKGFAPRLGDTADGSPIRKR